MNNKILFFILFICFVVMFIFSSVVFFNSNKATSNESTNITPKIIDVTPIVPVIVYTPENKFIKESIVKESTPIIENKFIREQQNNYSLTSMLYDNEINSTDIFITLSFNVHNVKLTCNDYINVTQQIVQYTNVALFLFTNTSCKQSRPVHIEYTLPSGKKENISHLISYDERKFYFNFS